MNVNLISVFVLVAACMTEYGTVTADDPPPAPEMTCKQFVSQMMKRQLGGITKCTKSLNFKSGKEKAARMTCILKCVMQAEGLLDKDGFLTPEQFNFFIKKELPPSMYERGTPILENCMKTTSAGLDPKENLCKTYDPLIKCFLGAIMLLCPS